MADSLIPSFIVFSVIFTEWLEKITYEFSTILFFKSRKNAMLYEFISYSLKWVWYEKICICKTHKIKRKQKVKKKLFLFLVCIQWCKNVQKFVNIYKNDFVL